MSEEWALSGSPIGHGCGLLEPVYQRRQGYEALRCQPNCILVMFFHLDCWLSNPMPQKSYTE
jgi:hypothetical protein